MGTASMKIHAQDSVSELLDDLIESVNDSGKDIMRDEYVLVPTKQTAAFIREAIVRKKGICSGISFETLQDFATRMRQSQMYAADTNRQLKGDPWHQDNLTWRILEALEDGEVRKYLKGYDDGRLWDWLALGCEDDPDLPQRLRDGEYEKSFEDFIARKDALAGSFLPVMEYLLQHVPAGKRYAAREIEFEKVTKRKTGPEPETAVGNVSVNRQALCSAVADLLAAGVGDNEPQSRPADLDSWCASVAKLCVSAIKAEADRDSMGIDGIDSSFVRANLICSLAGKQTDQTKQNLNEALSKANSSLEHEVAGRIRPAVKSALKDASITQEVAEGLIRSRLSFLLQPGTSPLLVDLRMRRSRRLRWAQDMAKRYLRYADQAPQMLVAWRSGQDVFPDSEGHLINLPDEFAWQAFLWRHLCNGVEDVVGASFDPASFACELDCASAGRILGSMMVSRIHVYGYTYLSQAAHSMLECMPTGSVHMFCLAKRPAWGMDSWDAERASLVAELGPLEETVSQSEPQLVLDGCMGAPRQIEVLQDLVVSDVEQGIRPDDILVVAPDMQTFGPLVKAAFSASQNADDRGVHPATKIRTWLAFDERTQGSDAFDFLCDLMSLVQGRAEFGVIDSILHNSSVARKSGLSKDSVNDLIEMLQASHVHWGWDLASAKRRYVAEGAGSTWASALATIALGTALDADCAEETPFEGSVPLSGLPSQSVSDAARLISLVGRLQRAIRQIQGKGCDEAAPLVHTRAEWASWMLDALGEFCAAYDDVSDQSIRRMGKWLRGLCCESYGCSVLLTKDEVSALLAGREGRVSRPDNFMPGRLAVCGVGDVTCVPFKHVIVLGISDATFPNSPAPEGDDVLAWELSKGDALRIRRENSGFENPARAARQALLGLLDGAQKVNLIFDDRDVKTAQKIDPPTAVVEMVEHDDACRILKHPLMSYVAPTDIGRDEFLGNEDASPEASRVGIHREPYTSFNPMVRGLYKAATNARRFSAASELSFPIFVPPTNGEDRIYDIDDLIQMICNPTKWFVNRTLGIYLHEDETSDPNLLSLSALTPLQKSMLIDELVPLSEIEGSLFGNNAIDERLRTFVQSGDFPARGAVQGSINELGALASRFAFLLDRCESDGIAAVWRDGLTPHPISVELAPGVRLTGSVETLSNGVVLDVGSYGLRGESSLNTKRQDKVLGVWIKVLALAAAGCEVQKLRGYRLYDFEGEKSNLTDGKSPQLVAVYSKIAMDEARAYLLRLTRIYDIGCQMPLPFNASRDKAKDDIAKTCALATAKPNGSQRTLRDARIEKCKDRKGDFSDWEQGYPELVWGRDYDWRRIIAAPSPKEAVHWIIHEEAGAGKPTEGESFFDVLVQQIWMPLIKAEERFRKEGGEQ